MSLSDLASIGSFISGLAVLLSLVFLYFQLRQVGAQVQQAERNQQASIRQGRATRVVGLNLAAAEPSLADALAKGMAGAPSMTSTQLTQFSVYCRAPRPLIEWPNGTPTFQLKRVLDEITC